MLTPDIVETGRLRLRPVRSDDAAGLHSLWILPEVRRYLWDDQIVPMEQTRSIVERSRELFSSRGFGIWCVDDRLESTLVGFGGFWYFRDPPELELLLGLHPERWHQGLATEAGLALIRHGFGALDFHVIRGSTDAPNEASIRLMARLGMRFDRRETVDGRDTIFYRITTPGAGTKLDR